MKRVWPVKLVCLFILFGFYNQTIQAQQDNEWWFDVEVMIFKRSINIAIEENFKFEEQMLDISAQRNLFALPLMRQTQPYFDIWRTLPSCDKKQQPPLFTSVHDLPFLPLSTTTAQNDINAPKIVEIEQDFSESILIESAKINLCFDNSVPEIPAELPLTLTAPGNYIDGTQTLVSSDFLRMQEFIDRVSRQPDIQPLLHTVWRQKVDFGEDNADFFAISAGKKLTFSNSQASPIVPEAMVINTLRNDPTTFPQMLSKLQKALDEQVSVTWEMPRENDAELTDKHQNTTDNVYEIEGRFKVYLDYINRIPYLHIDADLMHHRLELDENGLASIQSFPFNQRRRIISKQIHYFDHPAFGMIVRLERYQPLREDVDEDLYQDR